MLKAYTKFTQNIWTNQLLTISYNILKLEEVHFSIMKTYLYNFDPLKPHIYIVKLGFTGVYIIFLISAQNIDCGFSWELPQWGGSNKYPQSMFWAEIWKNIRIFIWKLFLNIFEYACSRNGVSKTAWWVANSVDIDQMPHSAVSDLGLHCLHQSVYPNTISKNTIVCLMKFESKHYENRPIQIYWKFHHQKSESFQIQILIFFIFLFKT